MTNNIDIDKCQSLAEEVTALRQSMKGTENKIASMEEEIKHLLPKGYWYTMDIDKDWKHPKKYSIKKVECYDNDISIIIKEVFKKKPWAGFTGEHRFYLDKFLTINRFDTDKECYNVYIHRICPKCGGFMGDSEWEWCEKCLRERSKIAQKFQQEHTYYCPSKNDIYHIGYEDEISNLHYRGYDGHHFVIYRLDTNETIETCNLWVDGYWGGVNNLPEIEFIEGGNYV